VTTDGEFADGEWRMLREKIFAILAFFPYFCCPQKAFEP